MKLWVNISFLYDKNKLSLFNNVKDSILNIKTEETKIIINSNFNFSNDLNIQIFNNSNLLDLAYEHKKSMHDFLESDFTHFLYIEHDMLFTENHLKYWLEYRYKLKEFNFLPAFHRFETKNNKSYSVDITQKAFNIITINNEKYISLFEPYQGLMLMDKELVKEHIDSGFDKVKSIHTFGHLESANSAYIYCNVPNGFLHRLLLPIKDFKKSLIHHTDNKYCNMENIQFGKIDIDELYDLFVKSN
jgi:hypothetical protein